jgi:hypothetical protein
MQTNLDGGPGDLNVTHGGLLVGRLYKRSETSAVGAEWLWSLNGVPEGPVGLAFTGLAATRDEALTALTERWSKWLDWAKLGEQDPTSGD